MQSTQRTAPRPLVELRVTPRFRADLPSGPGYATDMGVTFTYGKHQRRTKVSIEASATGARQDRQRRIPRHLCC